MIDIAEGCTGALQNMAKDRESRELIRNMNIIPAVCDLMCIDHQEKVMTRKDDTSFRGIPISPTNSKISN